MDGAQIPAAEVAAPATHRLSLTEACHRLGYRKSSQATIRVLVARLGITLTHEVGRRGRPQTMAEADFERLRQAEVEWRTEPNVRAARGPRGRKPLASDQAA